MRHAEVKLVVLIPDDDATDEQIHEWISYNVHERAELSMKNPLVDLDIETEWDSLEVDVIG